MRVGRRKSLFVGAVMIVLAMPSGGSAQQHPQSDSSTIAPDGTAYVTRIVPVPRTVSPEAQKSLARVVSDAAVAETLAQRREHTDKWQAGAGELSKKLYPANISADTIAGVPVRVITPLDVASRNRDRVLINLHGGGFNSDSGSLTETIPIANLTGIKVIAVLYRLAPEHPFPAGLDDAVAVYKELLKTYQPNHIGIYGTSAGAILTAEVTAKLKQLKVAMPAASGIFSGMGDFSKLGDSFAIYALNGFSGHLDPPKDGPRDPEYVGATDLADPVLSPVYANLSGFPPTLFITSGRDLLLSGTTVLHRAYLRAGVDAQLVVFEALPHAFWNNPELPESKEADQLMAGFFMKYLGK
ncbi:MAG TPA: alpha/beta hydrolase fold domain-containing protein [Candidatus Acidoferrum sp.]|nr:alpha/beta hydrolase fold domain-containing protein [Candidatus Acidoferrum sp.]